MSERCFRPKHYLLILFWLKVSKFYIFILKVSFIATFKWGEPFLFFLFFLEGGKILPKYGQSLPNPSKFYQSTDNPYLTQVPNPFLALTTQSI